jgi:GT2 family glycosyltransferase
VVPGEEAASGVSGRITIVVPVWNGRVLVEKLLASLRAQTHPIAEILVVDNGSSDGSAEAAEQAGARVVRMGSNAGFARAVNRGIAECRTEWLAIVNSDVETAPDWLAHLAAALDDGDAWFATGKILKASEDKLLDGTFDALSRGGCAWRAGNGRFDGPEFGFRRRIAFPPGTAALFRAQLFGRIGTFDESFESYLEDVELGLRCAVAGLSGWYVPEAIAWHCGSASLGRWHADTVRRISRNQVFIVAKHYSTGLLVRFLWPILVGQCLWGLVAMQHGTGWAWLRGKFSGLFHARLGRVKSTSRLRAILDENDDEILGIQRKIGFDTYWRWYFLLTRGGAS